MIFKDAWVLILVPLIILVLMINSRLRKKTGFRFPSDMIIKGISPTIRSFFYRRIHYLKIAAVFLVVLAMARPLDLGDSRIKKEGIAIMFAIDCSSTMLAEDLSLSLEDMVFMSGKVKDYKNVNRLQASVSLAEDLIKKRKDDMIGVVAFAASAFLVCPLTFDHEWLREAMDRLEVGLIRDGTAIGSGILSALNSLKDIKAKSRIIILLTDGVNNYGQVSPVTAAKTARALGIRVYTIGISGSGVIDLPVKDQFGRQEDKKVFVELDEEGLKKIADITGGEYFRAENMGELRKSFLRVDRLERTELEEKGYERYQDIYRFFFICRFDIITFGNGIKRYGISRNTLIKEKER
jgi:Ca-activated chloride channel family protein